MARTNSSFDGRVARIAAWVILAASPALAQTGPDTAGQTPKGFSDLESLYRSLPPIDPRPFDQRTALIVAITGASCVDNPQSASGGGVPYLWQPAFTPIPDYEASRSFWGCLDWHSHANTTWALVRILKEHPDLSIAPMIRSKLNQHLGASTIAGELAFYSHPALAASVEIPYGFAWILRLQYELRSWNDSDAVRWAANVQPFATYIADRLVTYFRTNPDQPVRTGQHFNTALNFRNVIDYASRYDPVLDSTVRELAMKHFARDINCNTDRELGPTDFHSSCLTEAALMARLMPQAAYLKWLDRFLPPLYSAKFSALTQFVDPTRSQGAGARSHYLGLGFLRGASLLEIANALPANDPRVRVMRRLAAVHGEKSLDVSSAVGYVGTHYAAAIAMMYIEPTLPAR